MRSFTKLLPDNTSIRYTQFMDLYSTKSDSRAIQAIVPETLVLREQLTKDSLLCRVKE